MSATLIQDTEGGLAQTEQQASMNDQPDSPFLKKAAGAPQTRTPTACRNTGIHHVAVYARNPATSAEFYKDILGMQMVGGSAPGEPFGPSAFLSGRPDEEHHEIALFANKALAHVAFKVASLTELRRLYARVVERNIKIKFLADHGVSLTFYFADPDGNLIEVYWPTGDLSVRKPHMERLDLSQPDEVLLDKITARQSQATAAKLSGSCRNTGIHHAGLYAKDPAASAEFYRDILGMQITGGSTPDHPVGATAFLSSRPDEEHHEIALFANPEFAHIAFKVSSLDELRAMYNRIVEKDTPIRFTADHGCSFAIYFGDPDGNMIEVYWPTGDLSRQQPHMEPLDLSQPDEVLLRNITPKPAHAAANDKGANGTATVSWRNQVKYVPAGTGPAYWGPGDQLAFLITGEETGGAFFLAEMSVPPGGGPPPHIHHREEESFYIIEGKLTVQVGGKTITASAGDYTYLPRGIVHCFKNNGDVPAKALVLATPAGLENFFAEAFDPAADRSLPPPLLTAESIARLVAAFPKHGLELIPPRA